MKNDHDIDWNNAEWDEELGDFVSKKTVHKNEAQQIFTTKDANGTLLREGDSVFLVRDLDVKGASIRLKRGEKIKNIRLVENPEHVECKVGKSILVLKSCFLKKAS